MALDGLLGQEQPLGDRAVAEAFGRESRRRAAGRGQRRGAGELRAARPGAGRHQCVPRAGRERGRAAALGEVERLAQRLPPAERDERVGALERRRVRAPSRRRAGLRIARDPARARCSAIPSSRATPNRRARSICSSHASSASDVRPVAASAAASVEPYATKPGLRMPQARWRRAHSRARCSASCARPCASRSRARLSIRNVKPNSSGQPRLEPGERGPAPRLLQLAALDQRVDQRRDHERQRGPVARERQLQLRHPRDQLAQVGLGLGDAPEPQPHQRAQRDREPERVERARRPGRLGDGAPARLGLLEPPGRHQRDRARRRGRRARCRGRRARPRRAAAPSAAGVARDLDPRPDRVRARARRSRPGRRSAARATRSSTATVASSASSCRTRSAALLAAAAPASKRAARVGEAPCANSARPSSSAISARSSGSASASASRSTGSPSGPSAATRARASSRSSADEQRARHLLLGGAGQELRGDRRRAARPRGAGGGAQRLDRPAPPPGPAAISCAATRSGSVSNRAAARCSRRARSAGIAE